MTESTIATGRSVLASPEHVFDAWTDAAQLAAWWWPQLAGTTYDVDARPGGSYTITSPAIGVTVHGVYTEVHPSRRLAFTWNWEVGVPEQGVQDMVVVTFEPQGDATQLRVEHTSVAHEPDGSTEQGWNDVLARLTELFSGEAPRQSTSSRS
ncbi:MAG TPA: SRPBCC family protein [Nocardioides sp.]|jgi:uncharacterized protein YndB with AHSA1/START domain|nr:SRPBCC family protein [Nocardioides sp.]